VAVLAVDPSSPVSGGALLGDRTRMGCTTNDPGVFVRSVASRGHLGGLSLAVPSMLDVLDVAGFDDIIVEAVGAGQSEVEISRFVDTTVVLTAPGLGDDVQAIKAGILEVADVLVVHKADLPGSSDTQRQLEAMLDLRDAAAVPAVLLVSAHTGSGLDRLVETIDAAHRDVEESSGPQRRATEVLRQAAAAEALRRLDADPALDALGAAFHRGELALGEAAQQLIERTVRHP
ncbi:MAG: methylmalonyl Co-A mutase-associated GTPase MeaB, partial [Actinomycetota bacterium]